MVATAALSMDNPVFRMFLGYAALVIVKTMIMSTFTAYQRITNKAFANEEDGGKKGINMSHAGVERVRRCHQNDLENVIPFVLLGLLYVATGPSLSSAALHFRIFAGSRFLHTFVYLFAVPQPSRALSFLVGFVTCLSMAYNILMQAAF